MALTRKQIGLIEAEEKARYVEVYKEGYPSTGYSQDLAQFIARTAHCYDKLLDIGCGHGRVVADLRTAGYRCQGVDITLAGVPESHIQPSERHVSLNAFHEAPLWRMPFADNEFDYTFSTDVLEHLPPAMVDAAIDEIYRVTRVETLHSIAIIPSGGKHRDLHLMVKPISWWKKKFVTRQPQKRVDTTIVCPDGFIALCHYINRRRIG